ncbi:MAG: hypothetical protein Q9M91_06510 [Candidatus Dojkabacteria bacterium]|nr:hypothetical protein [Candidatus Dojkabacteria bacterium]
MTTDWYENAAALGLKSISSDITYYASEAKELLNSLGFTGLGLSSGQAEIRYSVLGLDGIFFEAETVNEADFVFISIFRKLPQSIVRVREEIPEAYRETVPENTVGKVYSTDPREGQVNLIVSNQLKNYPSDVFSIDFVDFDYSTPALYEVVTPDEALTNLQRGNGSLVYFQDSNTDYFANLSTNVAVTEFRVDATRTELAYWEPEDWAGYTYPIYVFKGVARLENGGLANFTFFVDAIKRL